MTHDNSIFGPRFGSSDDLYPTLQNLRVFLESPKKLGGQESHGSDLARYRELLDSVDTFERRQLQASSWRNVQETIFFRVIRHSQFANAALKLEVTLYKYHLHALMALDFMNPSALIKSAEEEISRLNPKREADAFKLARLRGMLKGQQKALASLKKQGATLEKELGHIALYIRDNLMKIAKRCETAIVILSDLQLTQQKERHLIEDIKVDFKERLRDALRNGPITKQHLVIVKRAVSKITQQLSVLMREDLFILSSLYEAIYAHGVQIAREIDAHMAKIESNTSRNIKEDRELFVQVGHVLVSLISDFYLKLKPSEIQNPSAHATILLEKRHEMIDFVLEMVQKERRAQKDRRSGIERRAFKDPRYKGPDRRSRKSRRDRPTRKDWQAPATSFKPSLRS